MTTNIGSVIAPASASSKESSRMNMLITRERVAYVGLLGKPRERVFGSLTVYLALGAPFEIDVGTGNWQSAEMFVVAPDTPHRIMTSDRLIGVLLIEMETVDPDRLPGWLQPSMDAAQCLPGLEQLRQAFVAFRDGATEIADINEEFDHYFFGQQLERRRIDPRVAKVVDKISSEPCLLFGAEDCAEEVDLSFSRFLHLFKEELGTTFRCFRAWKRARSFLNYVNIATNLTDIALDIGYPDSSHFSHTVRRYWGLTPKDILAGSRRLAVVSYDRHQVAAA
jgi:AraC-like DNA-binding protein